MAAPSRRKHQMPSKRSGSLHRRLWEPLMSELMWSSTSTSGAVVSGAFQGEFASESPGRGMMRKMPRRSSTLWSQLLRSLQRVSKVWVLRLLRMRIKPSHGLNLLALSAYHESKFENVTLAYCYLPLMTYVIEDSRLCSFLSSAWNFDYFAKSWYLRGVQSTYTWGVITLSHFSLHQWNVLYVWQMSSSCFGNIQWMRFYWLCSVLSDNTTGSIQITSCGYIYSTWFSFFWQSKCMSVSRAMTKMASSLRCLLAVWIIRVLYWTLASARRFE